ncbi:MAG: hypothetical protein NXI20_28085, partial [bacterium]|nr:hypothetical protein [bacterium]
MKRFSIITGLIILSFGLTSIDKLAIDITGDTTPDLGGTYTYTFDPPSQYFLPTWTVSNGTIQGTYSNGSLYWVDVKWDQGEGSGSVVFKNGSTTIKSLGVTVSSALTAGSIGGTKTICYNASAGTMTNSAGAGGCAGGCNYLWQKSTNGSTWTTASGSNTGATYSPGNLTATTWFRRRVSDDFFTKYTSSVKVTVKNLGAGSISTASKNFCYNSTPGLINASAATNNVGTRTYTWQKSTNNSTWVNVPSSNTEDYTPPALTATTWYRRRVVDNCATKYTTSVKFTVKNLNPGSIGNAQTLCYNGNPSALSNTGSASGNNGSVTYQWQISSNGSSGWTNISGATGTTYDPGSLTSNKWYRRRAIDGCFTKYTNTIKITVTNLNAGSINGLQTICYNGDPSTLGNSSSASNAKGSVSYQWQYSNNGSSGWTNISGATGTTYNPPSGLTVNRWYRRRAIDQCATKYSNTIPVTVRNLTAGSIGGTQTICYSGDPGTLSNSSSAGNSIGSVSYQWQYSNNGSSGWTNISGATGTTYNPPSGLTVNRWYRRRVIDNCFTKYTNSIKVTVKNLSAGSINNFQTICYNGDPGTFGNSSSASNYKGTLHYQWQYSNNGSSGWTN